LDRVLEIQQHVVDISLIFAKWVSSYGTKTV